MKVMSYMKQLQRKGSYGNSRKLSATSTGINNENSRRLVDDPKRKGKFLSNPFPIIPRVLVAHWRGLRVAFAQDKGIAIIKSLLYFALNSWCK